MGKPRLGSTPWWEERGVTVLRDGHRAIVVRFGFFGRAEVLGVVDLFGMSTSAQSHLLHSEVFDMLQRGTGKRVEGSESVVMTPDGWAGAHPRLFEHLTQTAWPDGTTRQTSSLTIFVDGGQFKAVLKDKDEELCLWMAALAFEDIFVGLELALSDERTVWRLDRAANGGKSSRVQKGR